MRRLESTDISFSARVLVILCSIAILSIVGLSAVTWQKADDFSVYTNIKSHANIFHDAAESYKLWDGRAFSPGKLLTVFMIEHAPSEVSNFVWSLFFVGYVLMIFAILRFEMPGLHIATGASRLIVLGILCSSVWLSMGIHDSQTIYWATGGFYTFDNFFQLLWIYYLLKMMAQPPMTRHGLFRKTLNTIGFFLFSALLGMSSQNLSPALLCVPLVLAIMKVLRKTNLSPEQKCMLLVSTLGILTGSAIMFLAPGNFVRAHQGIHSFQFGFSTNAGNLKGIIADYLYIVRALVLLTPFSALILTFITAGAQRRLHFFKTISIIVSRLLLVDILDRAKWLVFAALTIVPLMAVPDFRPARAAIFCMTYLIIFLLESFLPIFSTLLFGSECIDASPKRFIHPAGAVLIVVFITIFYGIMAVHYGLGWHARSQLMVRDTFLRSPQNSNKDVDVPPVSVPFMPFALSIMDITADSSDWKNIAVAQYYHLRSIRLKPPNAH
jgi:hypothetical protein